MTSPCKLVIVGCLIANALCLAAFAQNQKELIVREIHEGPIIDHATRTPLGAIEEEDGTFTVVYTARYDKDGRVFFGLGRVVLAWK